MSNRSPTTLLLSLVCSLLAACGSGGGSNPDGGGGHGGGAAGTGGSGAAGAAGSGAAGAAGSSAAGAGGAGTAGVGGSGAAGTGGGGQGGGVVATTITVLNGDGNSLLSWPITANGNVAPSAKLSGPTSLLNLAGGLAADSQGNLYVTQVGGTILVFAPHQNGDVAPARVIKGSNVLTSDLEGFNSVAVDPSGRIYVLAFGMGAGNSYPDKILVFAAGANGNAAPVQIIAGANTMLTGGATMTYSAGNIYAEAGGKVLVFDANANGNVTPTRSWSLPTGTGPAVVQLAGDAMGNLYVPQFSYQITSTSTAVNVFPPLATTPSRTLAGASSEITEATGVAVDQAGTLYVANADPSAAALLVFAPGANGATAPVRNISGPSTTLNVPTGGYVLFITVY
jgi:hypothetical protein